jgi:predicted DNA-binding protein with PD1-like motif
VDQQVEVVSLLGNVARKDGKPKLHLHGAFGDRNAKTYSGHVVEAFVNPTLEVFLTDLGRELRRERDARTGLDLLVLEPEPPEEPLAVAPLAPDHQPAIYTP